MTHKSAEEVNNELREKLGEEFGGDLNYLKNEYLNVRIGWRFYRSLFGTNKERVELLNEVSGIFFYTIEKALFEQTILGLCRLTDPITTGRGAGAKKNLTYKLLGDFLPAGEVRENYVKLLTKTDELAKFARDWRNRKIAHSDYEVVAGEAKLDKASREAVQALMDSVGELLQFIYHELFESDFCLEVLLAPDDEMSVLEFLFDGKTDRERIDAINQKAIDEKRYNDVNYVRKYPDWLTRVE